jgi:hypothetical protein
MAFTLAERYVAWGEERLTDGREPMMAKRTKKSIRPAAKRNERPTLRYRVILPDDAAKRGLVGTRVAEIRQLRAIANERVTERERFRDRAVLAAVYDLYRSWVNDGRAKTRARAMIKLFQPRVRGAAHPITVILASTLKTLDQQIRSKWSLAVQYASRKNVAPEKLSSFMDQNGGMAGCAKQFARLHKAKHGVPKKKKRLAPKSNDASRDRLRRTRR